MKRLAEGQTELAKLLDAAEHGTAPRTGAQERVWKRLREPRRRRAALWIALASCAGVAAVVLIVARPEPAPQIAQVVHTTPPVPVTEPPPPPAAAPPAPAPAVVARIAAEDGAATLVVGDAPAHLARNAALSVTEGRVVQLSAGALSVEAHGLLVVKVGAYDLEATSASFVVRVAERRVIVDVRRGSVKIDGALVEKHWDSAPPPSQKPKPVARVEAPPPPPPPTDAELHARARALESAGDYAAAAELYVQLAPREPTALYELGRLRQRRLHDTKGALEALDTYRAREPDGPLALEASLSAVEARLALGDEDASLREMTSFLDKYGASERAPEVRWLRASLLASKGRCAAAQDDLQQLAASGPRADDASFTLASCTRAAGDVDGARQQLEAYLQRFPKGHHAAEAARALGKDPP